MQRNTMKRFLVVLLSLIHLVLLAASQSALPSDIRTPMRIDTHCHHLPPFYRDLLISRNITSGDFAIPTWNVSAHLALNVQLGIVTSVVSVSTPGAKLSSDAPKEEGRLLARQLNEYGYNLTVSYPKTFLFFASLTLPDLEGAVTEAIYALDVLKAAGIILEANAFGELLGTRRYDPLYKVLNERNAVVFVHPGSSPCLETAQAFCAAPNGTEALPAFLLDTTGAAVNLVYRNVTRDYPNISWILAHSGGFRPFAAGRAAGALAVLSGGGSGSGSGSGDVYLAELQDFYVDLAISATSYALPSTTAFFKSTHIIYGSDFPYPPNFTILNNTGTLQNSRLRAGVKNRINYRNSYRLFRKLLT